MKGNRIALIVMALLVAAAHFMSGCAGKGNAEDSARLVVETLFTCTLEEAQNYEELTMQTGNDMTSDEEGMSSGDDAITTFFENKYGSMVTEACLQQMMANRYCTKGIELASTSNADITAKDIIIEQLEGSSDFGFSAQIFAGDRQTATVSGKITMLEDGKTWKADYITMFVDEM